MIKRCLVLVGVVALGLLMIRPQVSQAETIPPCTTTVTPTSTPGPVYLPDKAALQQKIDELVELGISRGEWSKYISAPNAQGRIYYTAPAAASASAPNTFQFTRQLVVGSVGTDVKQLQTILAAQGFFKATPNGNFGASTKQAVKDYQKKNRLSQVGVLGPATRKLLNNSLKAITAAPAPTPCTPTPVKPAIVGIDCGQAKKVDFSSGNTFDDFPDTRAAWLCFTNNLAICQPATIAYGEDGQVFSVIKKSSNKCYVTGPKGNSSKTTTCSLPQAMLGNIFSQLAKSSPGRPYLKGFSAMMTFLWGTGGLSGNALVGYSCTK